MPLHILIVEDEPKIRNVLKAYLEMEGWQVDYTSDGHEAVQKFDRMQHDLVLLDLKIMGLSGEEVCVKIREKSNVPIIMVTSKDRENDTIRGLNLGADDYIVKPFRVKEVVARIKAVLRRSARRAEQPEAVPGLVIDEERYSASLDGKPLDLTPVEFRLLKTLASNPGRVFSRDQLLDKLYTDHRVVTDRTVDSHVKNLRRKLEQANPEREVIRSVYGVGYKFEA